MSDRDLNSVDAELDLDFARDEAQDDRANDAARIGADAAETAAAGAPVATAPVWEAEEPAEATDAGAAIGLETAGEEALDPGQTPFPGPDAPDLVAGGSLTIDASNYDEGGEGIAMVESRIALATDDEGTLEIGPADDEDRTLATVRLPLERLADAA